MVTRRWRWRLLKAGLAAALLWVVLAHFFPSWGEMEAMERLKATQRRHEKMLRESGGHGMDEVVEDGEEKKTKTRVLDNEILPGPTKKRRTKEDVADGGGGYRNSKTLQVS